MTREELRGIVEGITDEQLKKILDIHSLDIGKAKGDREELKAELDKAKAELEVEKTKLNDAEREIGALKEGQCEADEMKLKIEELQKVIDQNAQAEAKKATESEFLRRFDTVSVDKKFVNEMTRSAVFEEFKAALLNDENADRSDMEIYQLLVNSKENIFEPQGGIPSLVGSTIGFGGDLTEGDVREIMGLN